MDFINLTNGIEALSTIKENVSFIRIQSTTIERKNWIKLFLDLDYNLLLNLALGNECIVYDFGTNRNISKTIYLGLPIIEYVLTRYWFGKIPKAFRYSRRNGVNKIYDVDKFYDHIYNELFIFNSTSEKEKVKTKLNYFKKFLLTQEINLIGISQSTCHDGDYVYYHKLLKQWQIS